MDEEKKLKCPWCGKKIKHYKCKNGEFYGCSEYPKCEFKKNIRYTQIIQKEEDSE